MLGCYATMITHSSIAILLIWFMKPNVFELHAPISKVAMPGCSAYDHTQQHCYFADMVYETKCV